MTDRTPEQALLRYVRAMTDTPQVASLASDELPEALRPLGEALIELGASVREECATSEALKRRHACLTELMRRVAAGNYGLRADFEDDLSIAFNDMVGQLHAQKQLLELTVSTDQLTSAGTSTAAYRRMNELWQAGRSFVLAQVDLDKLKECNALYGHAEGNRFLQATYRILADVFPDGTRIYRFSDDTFLLLSEALPLTAVEEMLENARTNLRAPNQKEQRFRRSFSFACAYADASQGGSYQQYLREAEEKLYHYRFTHRLKDLMAEQPAETGADVLAGLRSPAFEAFAAVDEKRYLYLCDVKANVARWSQNAVRDFGLPGEYFSNPASVWASYIHPDDRQAYLKDIEAVFAGKKRFHNTTYRARNKSGDYIVCTCKGYLLRDKLGNAEYFAGAITNHGMIDRIDPVTGLYNVYKLMDDLRRYKAEKRPVSLLMLGINQFRRINNSYGFDFGNQALQRFAQMMLDRAYNDARLFRLNGVNFCVLIDRHVKFEEIDAIYREISDIARNHLVVDDREIHLTVAGGSLSFQRIDAEENAVLAELEYALSTSKKDGQGLLVHFDDSRHMGARRQLELIDTLIRSVLLADFHGFFLEYQPQVRADGRIVGAEALVRWKDEAWGRVPPNDFIPILEHDSCFYELGMWILQTALREVRPIIDRYENFTISVNVSYRQLEQPSFKTDVLQIVNEMGFPAHRLTLELTEHCRSIQQEVLAENLSFLRAAGIRISADDFGTGYSSLALLRDLPFDCIKIDRTFISDIVDNNPDQIIVKSTIQCAKDFGIHVCVEGVEDVPSLMTVDAFQPDMYQGYLYSRPISLEELLRLFEGSDVPRIKINHPVVP